MNKLGIALCGLALLALVSTLVSLIPSDMWFLRTVDMVRELLVYFTVLLLLATIFVRNRFRGATAIILVAVAVINGWRVWPYWSVAGSQMQLAETTAERQSCFTALAANVKVKNDAYGKLANQLRRLNPDVLFLMETDKRWIEALEPVFSQYPHVQRHPQPEAFGLVFASRLPVAKSNVVENTYRDTPTLYATLLPAGFPPVEFIGLHPKPPLPGWNTEMRDKNIVNAGVQTPDRLPEAVVMGDFNDVPWSRTTEKFRTTGKWLDPRIGRGSYPTFPADLLPLGWPLDQLMIKGEIYLASFQVLPNNGSDHRAMRAVVCPPSADPQVDKRRL